MHNTSDIAAVDGALPPPRSGLSDDVCAAVREHALASVDAALENSASLYVRDRDLPKLITVTEADVASGYAGIRTKLSIALDRERRLGAADHWSYSAARHMALKAALMAEASAA